MNPGLIQSYPELTLQEVTLCSFGGDNNHLNFSNFKDKIEDNVVQE
jgi:hypothetical protein